MKIKNITRCPVCNDIMLISALFGFSLGYAIGMAFVILLWLQ